ncbi:hypothetical protein JOC95_001944 [Bacillus tianshenii]|uniref:Uncharacterized protein n=1 Tax=Sutcliffiella tianshenii TaxID=1463404 RepID=A0ABS2NZL4_9BACI|nr:hypothetical protein [Bacillus tianshenii]MBM7620092.1 hypothetical protein [Bacillus tianshenii]
MENISNEVRSQSIKAFQSTIRKCENALTKMSLQGSNTTLLTKRLKALQVGLAMLETAWNQTPHPYTDEEIAEARLVLTGLFPSLHNSFDKAKPGSPQRTLLERRIRAMELADEAMNQLDGN